MRSKLKHFINTYLISLLTIFFIIAIIVYPSSTVEAAHTGLMAWFTIVLPALLPFFIGSELLIRLGVVRFIGLLLEPIMRPLFNVPGDGSFAFAMSVTSGYPVGAKIISKLCEQKVILDVEAQRLISFCSTSGPLFIIGAVGVGMFNSGKLGLFIAANHFGAAILVGILFRFYKRNTYKKSNFSTNHCQFKKAIKELSHYGQNRPLFGQILGNSVKESIDTILLVGGFIILFSVIVNILSQIGFMRFITTIVHSVPFFLSINPSVINSITTGFFEITLGSKMISDVYLISLQSRLSIVAFIISWSGFSVHSQVISIISTTRIKTSIYLLSKLAHGLIASLFTYAFFPIFENVTDLSVPVLNQNNQSTIIESVFNNFLLSTELFMRIIFFILLFTIFVSFSQYLLSLFTKKK
ncbi:MAG: sporulation integral membrane protein YlbJ [Alkaliphilus sp.]|nr:MAG: sporulation integral membrane protein YlbJ [Alkaliphilus sp.]